MVEKYQNKYRIESTRLQNWDYGSNGAYFVTICTHKMAHFFGEIVNGKMELNEIGEQANTCFIEIPNHFPYVELGNYIVMPNHVHTIIIIKKTEQLVETQDLASLQLSVPTKSIPKNKFGPQSKNLASIIRGYKIGVTKYAKKINPEFAWEPRYYDWIIRNKKSFNRIQDYIIRNPETWNKLD